MAVTYEEYQAPEYDLERGKGTATRYFLVPNWDDLNAFFAEKFPTFLSGNLPAQAEAMPGFPWMYASKIRVEPFDKEKTDTGTPPKCASGANVTITYSTPTYDQNVSESPDTPGGDPEDASEGPGGTQAGDPQNYLSYSVKMGGQLITHDGLALMWSIDQKPCGNEINGGMTEMTIEHQIAFHFVPLPPWRAIRRCVNKTNDRTFLGAPRGCLLFLGAEGGREITVQGVRQWQLTMSFSEKNNGTRANPKGWNYFLRSTVRPATYELVRIAGNNDGLLYPEESFKNLFKPNGR